MNKGWCRGNWLIVNGVIHYGMLYSLKAQTSNFLWKHSVPNLIQNGSITTCRTKQQQLTTVTSSLNADDMNVNDWRCNNEVEHFAVEGA